MQRETLKTFVVYFRYQVEGEKGQGPVRHHKFQAGSARQAEKMLRSYANYPGLEILRVEEI